MKLVCRYLLVICLILACNTLYSQETNTRKVVRDQVNLAPENSHLSDTTTKSKYQGKNSDNVYNRLTESKNKIVRNFANVILIGGDPSVKEKDEKQEQIQLSENYYKDFEGLTIDSIIIDNKDIYFAEDSMSTGSWLERTIDKLHIQTRRQVISKYLKFSIGDTVNAHLMSVNEYILRDLPFLASAYIMLRTSSEGSVVATVLTRDKWTISATGALGDYPYACIYDENFLGSGNKLSVSYLHQSKCQRVGGQVEYIFRNIGGKFIESNVQVGVGERNNVIYGDFSKKYLYPGDNFWGIGYGYIEKGHKLLTYDTTYFTSKVIGFLSYGKSFSISKKDKSLVLYTAVGAKTVRYINSPIANYYVNPYYHDYSLVGAEIGIAKENFFQGNMIYGYGNIEDIPYGYKFELIGGYGYSSQQSHYIYYGGQARYAFYKDKFGFLNLSFTAAIKQILDEDRWRMGQIDFKADYFSPLATLGNGFYLRNFFTIRHTQGFNRLIGEREVIGFNSTYARVRGISTPIERLGTVRTVLNLESVLFTPFYFLHFRFAGFLWGDAGWLGDDPVFWKNKLCAATGIGIRIKNERIIINNLEIRLGIAIKKFPEKGYSFFGISNESRLNIESFKPNEIDEYEFK